MRALSPRELEVAYLMQQGFSNYEISEHLFIAYDTVNSHICHIYKKVGKHNFLRNQRDALALTPREEQVLDLIGQGYNNRTVALTLGIKTISVNDLLNRLYRKLGTEDDRYHPRVRLALIAIDKSTPLDR